MERKKFNFEEVIIFLEQKIIDNLESDEEMMAYENYKWDGKIKKSTYKSLLKEMYKEYRGE